jgi:hypothetical protein
MAVVMNGLVLNVILLCDMQAISASLSECAAVIKQTNNASLVTIDVMYDQILIVERTHTNFW